MARKNLYPPSVTPGIPKYDFKPDNWIETRFGSVLRVVKRKVEMENETEYQLVTAKRSRGGIVPREVLKGKQIKTKTQFYIKPGDFLISRRQIIHGACGVVPDELDGAIVSNEYSTLRPKNGLDIHFLDYFSHTVFFQQTCFQCSVGVDVEKMIFNVNDWLNYRVFLPPLPEQRRIANILGAWDEAISLTGRLIEAKQRRKQGLMQRLLTGSVRLSGFVKSEGFRTAFNTEVPLDWLVMEFDEFVSRDKRKFDPRKEIEELPCIELEHISQETGQILGATSTQEQSSIKNRFNAGQVLFGKLRPYLKKFARPDFDGACSSEIWVLAGKRKFCANQFLFYLVQSDRFMSAANVTSGTKMPRSDWGYLSETTFALPSPNEQRAIAAVLQTADEAIALLERKLAALRRQKQGLMQRLLTGQVRVGEGD